VKTKLLSKTLILNISS